MFFHRGLRVTGNVRDLIQARVSVVAALKLRPAAFTQALQIEGIRELQQPILRLRQPPKISGRRPLETLSRLQCG